jgi:hypothetical protein
MIKNHPSRDSILLSMAVARNEVSITKEQEEQFLEAVFNEADNAPWPKGFF